MATQGQDLSWQSGFVGYRESQVKQDVIKGKIPRFLQLCDPLTEKLLPNFLAALSTFWPPCSQQDEAETLGVNKTLPLTPNHGPLGKWLHRSDLRWPI